MSEDGWMRNAEANLREEFLTERRLLAAKLLPLLQEAKDNTRLRVACGAGRHDAIVKALVDAHHALVFRRNPFLRS